MQNPLLLTFNTTIQVLFLQLENLLVSTGSSMHGLTVLQVLMFDSLPF